MMKITTMAREAAMRRENEVFGLLCGSVHGDFCLARIVGKLVSGEPSRVEFDWNEVIKREENQGDVIGFYHTHPNSTAYMSPIDKDTMQAWVKCLGKPLVCVIDGKDGVRAHWVFCDGSMVETLINESPDYFFIGVPNNVQEQVLS